MKRIQKWSALLMAVTLLFTLAAPAALAAESTVTIKTAEDLAELSRNCTLDTWSQGKTVILALLRADAAAHLDIQAPLLCQRGNGSVVGKGAVLCAVQIHNVEIPGPGLHKLPGLCTGVLPVNGHTVIISLRQADNFAASQVNGWE